jgi:pyruvate dehydrogenase E2 component (dihydrolipoamide acetyltransferase)
MEEGQISAWHKKEGDEVGVDDLLAEVETDKATMEYRSFDKGTLLKILAPAGSVVQLGQPVAILGSPGEDVSALLGQVGGGAPANAQKKGEGAAQGGTEPQDAPKAQPQGAPKAQPQAEAQEPQAEAQEPRAEEHADDMPPADTTVTPTPAPPASVRNGDSATTQASPAKIAAPAGAPAPKDEGTITAPSNKTLPAPSPHPVVRPTMPVPAGRVKASPYVRKLARERGLNLAEMTGSGPGGRIIARDLEKLPPQAAKPQELRETIPPPVGGLEAPEARPLSMMRKAIARRLVESKQTVPHFYLTIDVDADPLAALRERINEDLAAAKEDDDAAPLKVSLNDLLIKACAIALTRVPECNAQFTPDALLIHRRVDISVAVAVPDGLVTPVVRDASTKSVLDIAAEVRDLAARARSKKLRLEEMQNGTFSISNLGMFGIDEFSAVINPPEGAILAVGQVRREPVVKGDAVVPGRRMAMTLSCDHRVIDGAIGATFLKALRALLEHPMQILMM